MQKANKLHNFLSHFSRFLLYCGVVTLPLFVLGFTRDWHNFPKGILLGAIVLSVAFLWLLDITITKEMYLRKTLLDTPFLVFLVLLLISSLVSVNKLISFSGLPEHYVFHFFGVLFLYGWFWFCVQYINKISQWKLLATLFLSSIVGVSILYITKWLLSGILNTIDSDSISLAVLCAVVGVIGWGLVLQRKNNYVMQIVGLLVGLSSYIVLLRLDFTVAWVMFCLGMGLLLVLGITLLAETRMSVLTLIFFLFLVSLLFIFFGAPTHLKDKVPLDISLGAAASWQITSSAFFDNIKTFLIGSGPGTFLYDFSKYRTASFNANQFIWLERFHTPYNTVFAILSETGILGFLAFFVIILLSVGSMFSGWLKTRPSVWGEAKQFLLHKDTELIRFEVFVFVVAWLTLSVAMFFLYFNFTLWWVWWTLLGIIIVGLYTMVPGLVKEKALMLKVSPQYALFLSFTMVFVLTIILVVSVLDARVYLAEVHYSKAIKENSSDRIERELHLALGLRPEYAPYKVALAKLYLQNARVESQNATPNADKIADFISLAVKEARESAQESPNSIVNWETLAVMYINARPLAPDANTWAIDALERSLSLEPSNAILEWRLADTYRFANQLDKAEEGYKKAIALKPDYAKAYIDLALLYESQNKLTEAINTYAPIYPAIENNVEALFNLGRLFYNRGEDQDFDKAKQLFERVISIEPNYSNALFSLGLIAERNGQTEAAKGYFSKALELNPDNQELKDRLKKL